MSGHHTLMFLSLSFFLPSPLKAKKQNLKKKKKVKTRSTFWPDGGVGRIPSLPCTTKSRITTNLISINIQKCQKIKIHGDPTTRDLKKQSTRLTRPVRYTDGENMR